MNNVATFETAQRLKNAGFPQPEIKVGQFWYAEPVYKGGSLEHIPLCIVVERYSARKPLLRRLTCEHMTGEVAESAQCFAPTAIDILHELGERFQLIYQDNRFAENYLEWVIIDAETEDDGVDYPHTNPSEAAALAYLSLHEKTEQ